MNDPTPLHPPPSTNPTGRLFVPVGCLVLSVRVEDPPALLMSWPWVCAFNGPCAHLASEDFKWTVWKGAVRSSINLLHPMWQTNQIGAHEVGQRRSGDGQSSTLHTTEINTSRKRHRIRACRTTVMDKVKENRPEKKLAF